MTQYRDFKLGLIARSDNSGLGIQTWEFFRHMNPDKTMVVDISKWNNNPTFPDRYPGEGVTFVDRTPKPADIAEFLEGLDVVFIAEAAYNPHLYVMAREMGVKTAVQYNYEFLDWLVNPEYPGPDMLIAPSRWQYLKVQKWCEENEVKHVYLHCPVAMDKMPTRQITQARTFLHLAGRAAAHDRNGTNTVIEASNYLKTPAQILVHFQGAQGLPHQATNTFTDYEKLAREKGDPSKLKLIQHEAVEYQDLYTMGDVLVLPRRYGGNCLPLNEALGSGMPVIMTDVKPNNSLLPHDWLVPAGEVSRFTPRTEVIVYGSYPEDLARKIDEFYNMNVEQMTEQNTRALRLGESISWERMKPQYEEVLGALCSNPS